VIQIVLPLAAIYIAWRVPTGVGSGQMSEDVKVSLISLGLLVPLLINSIANTVHKKEIDSSLDDLRSSFSKLDESISRLSPVLEEAVLSGNGKIMRFACRRMNEANTLLRYVVNNQRSGTLKPREYYEELDYLAQLIKEDKEAQGSNFTGEIWAMTSFAHNEWVDVDGYEGAWTETLQDMVTLGIKTERICIVPDKLMDAIKTDPFTPPENVSQFPGFIALLKTYYSSINIQTTAKHYIVKDTIEPDLTQAGGFFAIKLTNGEMHILTGETVDRFGSMTAEVVFGEEEIEKFRELCVRFMQTRYLLEDIISAPANASQSFHEYLDQKDVAIKLSSKSED